MKNTTRRNGKIARLPDAVRNHVNEMLRDGIPYPTIIKWLADNGHPGVIPMNLSRWFDGGYEDWLAERERERAHRDRLQWAAELEKECGADTMVRANLNLNAIQVVDALSYVDTKLVAKKLSRRVDKFCTMMNTNLRLAQELRVCEQERSWRKLREQSAASRQNPGSTDPPGSTQGSNGQ